MEVPMGEEFGPWMVVRRNPRQRASRTEPGSTPTAKKQGQTGSDRVSHQPISSSRFAALADLGDHSAEPVSSQRIVGMDTSEAEMKRRQIFKRKEKGKAVMGQNEAGRNGLPANFQFGAKPNKENHLPNGGSRLEKARKEGEGSSKAKATGMKRGQASRPKLLSPIQKRKNTERKDLVVAGSLLRKGQLVLGQENTTDKEEGTKVNMEVCEGVEAVGQPTPRPKERGHREVQDDHKSRPPYR